MSFETLDQSAKRLRAVVNTSTGRKQIAEVSLEPPGDDRGEAAFIKSSLWCYALWFEACQPAGRYLLNIVRNSSPQDHKAASRAFQDVQNLRTFHTHNLLQSNENDRYKLNQAKAWLAANGGTERNWDNCTVKLCSDLTVALNILSNHWNSLIASPEDANIAIQGLNDALERDWKPYLFDRMLEEVATSLGLLDFDSVKYRKTRLEAWREITDFFRDRTSAEIAVHRAIRQELKTKFGSP